MRTTISQLFLRQSRWGLSELKVMASREAGEQYSQSAFEDCIATLVSCGEVVRHPNGRDILRAGLSDDFPAHDNNNNDTDQNAVVSELSLMAPVEQSLTAWRRNSYGEHFLLVNTSTGGSRGGGLWSRPDFTAAFLLKQKYSSIREIALRGFELKRADGANILAVHEALAHTRFVHESTLIWHVPIRDQVEKDLADIKAECARHGIGMVTFQQADELDTWREELVSRRFHPEPDAVERYIDRAMREHAEQLVKWVTG
jgi:hypothetical protein